ncbi:MAG: hypothetical protein MSH41_07110 [Bacteroidales bacterium]|nr:hypothetical protein [Bacteroidales bacterium]
MLQSLAENRFTLTIKNMPNYCTNELKLKGNKKDIFALFQKVGFKGDSKESLVDFIENNKNKITMRSWLPMPQTFVDYDTTNPKQDRNEKMRNECGQLVSMFKSDKEYEDYSKGYDDAVTYQKETYGVVGWYNYNVHTLGVKWDAKVFEYGANVTEKDDEITVECTFNTAWLTPITWLTTLAAEFPKLYFQIDGYEPGMGFHDCVGCENGVVVTDYTEDYPDEGCDDNFNYIYGFQ